MLYCLIKNIFVDLRKFKKCQNLYNKYNKKFIIKYKIVCLIVFV